MTQLGPNAMLDLADVAVVTDPAENIVAGSPRTGTSAIGTFAGHEVGVWEMTAGSVTDVEMEELFVVLAGLATVEFNDGTAPLHLTAGTVVRLAAGAETTWTVTETLRKLYIA